MSKGKYVDTSVESHRAWRGDLTTGRGCAVCPGPALASVPRRAGPGSSSFSFFAKGFYARPHTNIESSLECVLHLDIETKAVLDYSLRRRPQTRASDVTFKRLPHPGLEKKIKKQLTHTKQRAEEKKRLSQYVSVARKRSAHRASGSEHPLTNKNPPLATVVFSGPRGEPPLSQRSLGGELTAPPCVMMHCLLRVQPHTVFRLRLWRQRRRRQRRRRRRRRRRA